MLIFWKIVLLCTLLMTSVLDACTIGVFGTGATQDSRPMLWKNRDVPNDNQEFAYFDDGRYSYVTNIYTNGYDKAWMGVNEVGFGIINSDTYNNGHHRHSGPDDGQVMKHALQYCHTVDDFEEYLIMTNATGRRGCHNYGVIDAYGGAAMFEAANTSYVRFDAADEPDGYIIRSNFALSGDTIGHRSGYERYLMAKEIMARNGRVDYRFVIDSLASNLQRFDLDPLPLPFEDPESRYPLGYITTTSTINRNMTRAVSVIVGKGFGDDNIHYPYMWSLFGEPIIAFPLPLWPFAGGVPESVDGDIGAEFCAAAKALRSTIYDHFIDVYFNTFNAATIRNFILEYRDPVFDVVDERLRDFNGMEGFNPTVLRAFQDSIISEIEAVYSRGVMLFVSEPRTIIPTKLSVSAYPNPFNAKVNIEIDPPSNNVHIAVYDVFGQLVENICEPDYNTVSSVEFAPNNLSSGLYVVRVSVPGFSDISTKIFYIK